MEKELLIECQRNSRSAQRKIYEKMAGRLYSVCRRYLKNDEDIEEVLADTFYKIFTKIMVWIGFERFKINKQKRP